MIAVQKSGLNTKECATATCRKTTNDVQQLWEKRPIVSDRLHARNIAIAQQRNNNSLVRTRSKTSMYFSYSDIRKMRRTVFAAGLKKHNMRLDMDGGK